MANSRTFVHTLRKKGLTPPRLALVIGSLVLLALLFILPFSGATGPPLLQLGSPTPPPTVTTPPPPPTQPPQPGDLDEDDEVNAADLKIVVAAFGTSPPSDPKADVNRDDTVDIFDLVEVALHFGKKR